MEATLRPYDLGSTHWKVFWHLVNNGATGPGAPDKAALALLKLVASDNPPIRLYLGADALKLVGEKIESMREEIATWETVSRSTDIT